MWVKLATGFSSFTLSLSFPWNIWDEKSTLKAPKAQQIKLLPVELLQCAFYLHSSPSKDHFRSIQRASLEFHVWRISPRNLEVTIHRRESFLIGHGGPNHQEAPTRLPGNWRSKFDLVKGPNKCINLWAAKLQQICGGLVPAQGCHISLSSDLFRRNWPKSWSTQTFLVQFVLNPI